MTGSYLAVAIPPLLALLTAVGCHSQSSQATGNREEQLSQSPERVMPFNMLYEKNCSGCHGEGGRNGAATDLANPDYEALIDDNALRDVIANGRKGTMMPGFAKAAGGDLTNAEVNAVVQGMRKEWFKGDVLPRASAPPYKSTNIGNAEHGSQVYASNCARCHGREGGRAGAAGLILDGSFLGLVSDQMIRTTAIAGRPDLGMPNFRNQAQGVQPQVSVMTDQDVTDVVAFLASRRLNTPGQPYPGNHVAPTAANNTAATTGNTSQ